MGRGFGNHQLLARGRGAAVDGEGRGADAVLEKSALGHVRDLRPAPQEGDFAQGPVNVERRRWRPAPFSWRRIAPIPRRTRPCGRSRQVNAAAISPRTWHAKRYASAYAWHLVPEVEERCHAEHEAHHGGEPPGSTTGGKGEDERAGIHHRLGRRRPGLPRCLARRRAARDADAHQREPADHCGRRRRDLEPALVDVHDSRMTDAARPAWSARTECKKCSC